MPYLKPCPFCGNPDIKVQSGTNVDCMTQYNGRYVYCLGCGTFKQVTRYSEWNNRATTNEEKILQHTTGPARNEYTAGEWAGTLGEIERAFYDYRQTEIVGGVSHRKGKCAKLLCTVSGHWCGKQHLSSHNQWRLRARYRPPRPR